MNGRLEGGWIRPQRRCGRGARFQGGITLLQYANDTIFFMEGSVEEAENLSTLLNMFADCLGLQVNEAKSVFVSFGMSMMEEANCASAFGTPIGTLPIRYLGFPLSGGHLHNDD